MGERELPLPAGSGVDPEKLGKIAADWRRERRRRAAELRRVAERLAEAFYEAGASEVFLFGSAAAGEAGPWSDLDLLVVAPGPTAAADEKYRTLLAGVKPSVPVDLWVFGSEDWTAAKERFFIRREVLAKGVRLVGRRV